MREIREPTYEMMSAGYDATRLEDGMPQFANAGFCIGHARSIYIAMRQVELAEQECATCDGTGWVCENHREQPWDGESNAANACGCGAGAPCAVCTPARAPHPEQHCGEEMSPVIHKGAAR